MARPIQKIITITSVLLTITIINCARFKVEKLKPETIFTAEIGKDVKFPNQDGLKHVIPGQMGIVNDWVIIPETSDHRLKIFKNSRLQVILVDKAQYQSTQKIAPATKAIDSITRPIEQMHYPGLIANGVNEDFYVANYTPFPSQRTKNRFSSKPRQVISAGGLYNVLHFNVKGELLDVIGRDTNYALSFGVIMRLDVDSEGRLSVLSNHVEGIQLQTYKNKKVIRTISEAECESILFENRSTKNSYTCEQMIPFFDGEKILLAGRVDRVGKARPKGSTFEFRVFKIKDFEDNQVKTVFANLNDPGDLPYIPIDQGHILIWQGNNKPHKIKWPKFNLEGDLVNNLQITLTGRRHAYRNTYATIDGRFFSIKVFNQKISIIEWK